MTHESDLRPRGRHGNPSTPRSLFSLVAVAVVALVLPGAARAQSPDEPPAPAASASGTIEPPKSDTQAFGLAVLGTGAGVAMVRLAGPLDSGVLTTMGIAFIVAGPSFGHFYAGETRRGLMHTGLRVGALGMAAGGLVWALHDCHWFGGGCEDNPVALTMFFTGLLGGAGSAVYSFIDAPRAARRHNARVQQLMLTPAPVAGPDRSTGFGLHLSGRF